MLRRMCVSTPGTGEPWPKGWQWEPMPFGHSEGWPVGAWPEGDKLAGCIPSSELIADAATELQSINYLPFSFVLGVIVVGVAVFLVSVLRAAAPEDATI